MTTCSDIIEHEQARNFRARSYAQRAHRSFAEPINHPQMGGSAFRAIPQYGCQYAQQQPACSRDAASNGWSGTRETHTRKPVRQGRLQALPQDDRVVSGFCRPLGCHLLQPTLTRPFPSQRLRYLMASSMPLSVSECMRLSSSSSVMVVDGVIFQCFSGSGLSQTTFWK